MRLTIAIIGFYVIVIFMGAVQLLLTRDETKKAKSVIGAGLLILEENRKTLIAVLFLIWFGQSLLLLGVVYFVLQQDWFIRLFGTIQFIWWYVPLFLLATTILNTIIGYIWGKLKG